MGDPENAATKKRVAGRQISKENPEFDDDGPEPEMGTFQRASDEVLATRRIVKVRRSQPAPASSNPFAALRLVPPSDSITNAADASAKPEIASDKTEAKDSVDEQQGKSEESKGTEIRTSVDESKGTEDNDKRVEEKTDTSSAKVDSNVDSEKDVRNGEANNEKAGEGEAKDDEDETEKIPNEKETETDKARKETPEKDNKDGDSAKPAASFSSFQQLSSSQNAFTGLAGTGFGTSSFSFGSVSKEGPTFGASSGSFPSFGTGVSNNGSFSFQQSASNVVKSEIPAMKEVPIETGEENEKAVFTSDAILYEYLDGGWKERGKGELKLNVSMSDSEKARVIMRARGNYRLILNASLYPDMTLANMDKKGITFACINSAGEGKDGLSTFALKFKDSGLKEEFQGVVEAHKGKKAAVLKTPENSPKASDD